MSDQSGNGVARWAGAVVLAGIALLGLVHWPMPFSGDQALFAIHARNLDAGTVLYRDMWDSKQPGIFLWYWIAGRVFGFNEPGVRVLEAVYLLAFALFLLRTSRHFLSSPAARLTLPLFVIGVYLLAANAKELGQVEVFAGLPIYAALYWSAGRDGAAPTRAQAFASGLAGGLVFWLKLYFLPIVGAIWILAWLRWRRPAGWTGFTLPLVAGAALPALALVAWLAANGVLQLAYWTYFVYPKLMAAATDPVGKRVSKTLRWFGLEFAPLHTFGLLGIGWAVTRRPVNAMLVAALAWLGVGALLVSLEVHWWRYYMIILTVPLGMLAAFGVQAALSGASRARVAVVVAVALVTLIPSGENLLSKMIPLVRHGLAIAPDERVAYRVAMNASYRRSREEADYILRQVPRNESVYVFGDPLILFLSGRTYAIPINGWSPEIWSIEVWDDALDQFQQARPDHVFMPGQFPDLVNERYPLLLDYFHEHYAASDTTDWIHRVRR